MKKIVRLTEQDLVRLVNRVIKEQNTPEDTSRFDDKVQAMIQKGYKVVPKFDLPDGEYILTGWGYLCFLNQDRKNTGYGYVTTGGIRGSWGNSVNKVKVTNGQIEALEFGKVYKILFNPSEVGKPQDNF